MFNIKFIRDNAEIVKDALRKKGVKINIDDVLKKDEKRRELIKRVEDLRHKKNVKGKEISMLKKEGSNADTIISEMQRINKEMADDELELEAIEKELKEILKWIPNIPHSSVPNKQKIIREGGNIPKFDFEPKDHLFLSEVHKILDMKTGAKIAGTHFPLYRDKGARLERALINFMLDLHTSKHNYVEIFPPFLAKEESMFGTGQLPKMKEDMYLVEKDNLYLNPTAEVPLTNIHNNDVLKRDELPVKYTAYTACFRREAGSYGKDTKGLMRVHQFNKVELVKFALPEKSYNELELLLEDAEDVLKLLNLPYRIVLLSYDDISFASAKTYDIEVWAPGLKRWLEVSSVSNFEDFQARRANIKYRDGNKLEFVHTLNGSGIATPRTFVGIIENFQKKDGSIRIPEVLWDYTKFREIP
ncbi:serine--tRNA ligase [candidate division WOR-3 bacterium]|nr:serine--tRNA ligase [candidate division WOR-3 bacterium]